MVEALHAWKSLSRTIVPRNVFQAEFLDGIVKVLPAKVFRISRDSVVDLPIPFFVVVCRPREWQTNRPHVELDHTTGQQQSENKQLQPSESGPPAVGLRCIRLRLNCDHLSFVSHSLGGGSTKLVKSSPAALHLFQIRSATVVERRAIRSCCPLASGQILVGIGSTLNSGFRSSNFAKNDSRSDFSKKAKVPIQ